MTTEQLPYLIAELDNISVGSLVDSRVFKKDLVWLSSHDPLNKAIEVLSSHGLQSAPVKDAIGGYWLGFLDVMDITTYILKIYCEGESGISYPEIQWNKFTRDFEQMEHKGKKYGSTLVKDVIGQAGETYSETIAMPVFVPIPSDASVFSVVKWMLSKGFHRTALYKPGDLKSDIYSVFTQSDVIQFLANNPQLLGEYRNQTIEQVGLFVKKDVASISLRAPAIIALYVMYFNRVSSVAVTTDDGEMVAAITPSDIKRIQANNLSKLLVPLSEFNRNNPGKLSFPLVGASSSTLESIISKLATYRVHKIFILDLHIKPIGVISTTDIMKWIAELKPDFRSKVPSELLSQMGARMLAELGAQQAAEKAQA